jgi:hypothetical protein
MMSNFNNQGFAGQGFNQGFGGQQVTQNQIDRIHQNSLFNGASQFDNNQVARIQQNTISGNMSNPLSTGFGGSFNQGFTNQAQGFGGQQVTQNQIDRIHQNSLFQGGSQYDSPEVARIHNASLFGGQSQPEGQTSFGNPLSVAGGFNQGFSNQAGFGQTTGFTGQLPNGGNQMQGYGMTQGFGPQGMMNQGFNQQGFGGGQVPSQVIDRIHQNSLFQGGSQRQGQTFQNPQSAGGFGGTSMMMGQGGGTFRAVMNADAGIRDNEGPDFYPASMYAGSNQYDTVNQNVLNQMVGRQF